MSPGVALGAMSLGELVDALARLPPDARVHVGSGRYRPTSLTSYRGYYEDLALKFGLGEPVAVAELRETLAQAVGQTFVGHKGGSYRAGRDTAVWVAASQSEARGDAVVAVRPVDDGYELVVERIDP